MSHNRSWFRAGETFKNKAVISEKGLVQEQLRRIWCSLILKTTKYLKFFFVFIAQKYMFWENILVLSGIFGDIKYEKMAYRVKDNLFEFYLISGEEGDFSGSGKKKKVLQLFRQFARKAILTFSFFF